MPSRDASCWRNAITEAPVSTMKPMRRPSTMASASKWPLAPRGIDAVRGYDGAAPDDSVVAPANVTVPPGGRSSLGATAASTIVMAANTRNWRMGNPGNTDVAARSKHGGLCAVSIAVARARGFARSA